jgi:hypothetical protein
MSTAAARLIAAAILSCATTMPTWNGVEAAEDDFLGRFRGSWSGSGKVQREGNSQPRQVTCSVTGSPAENRISAQGNCRAAVIFSRQIGVDLAYDPRSGLYRGTYTGSRIGPARLSGTRSGDTQAAMVIRNGTASSGRMRTFVLTAR